MAQFMKDKLAKTKIDESTQNQTNSSLNSSKISNCLVIGSSTMGPIKKNFAKKKSVVKEEKPVKRKQSISREDSSIYKPNLRKGTAAKTGRAPSVKKVSEVNNKIER